MRTFSFVFLLYVAHGKEYDLSGLIELRKLIVGLNVFLQELYVVIRIAMISEK